LREIVKKIPANISEKEITDLMKLADKDGSEYID